MKFLIIGLGTFGSSLAEKLTATGHEVMGVDIEMSKVEAMKDKIAHVISLDCTDPQAVTHLPLKDTDVVIVSIGEKEGDNIMATAMMKRQQVKRLISRAVSPLHEHVLEAMGVDEIARPEVESADRWAKKLNLTGVIDSFELTSEYSIIEAKTPDRYVGKSLLELAFLKRFNVVVLTTIKEREEKGALGTPRKITEVQGVASSQTVIEQDDILVMYGKMADIERLLEEE